MILFILFRWNFSVGHHDLEFLPGTNIKPVNQPEEEDDVKIVTCPGGNYNFKISMDNIVLTKNRRFKRSTDNNTGQNKKKGQKRIVNKILHKKVNIEQHNSH